MKKLNNNGFVTLELLFSISMFFLILFFLLNFINIKNINKKSDLAKVEFLNEAINKINIINSCDEEEFLNLVNHEYDSMEIIYSKQGVKFYEIYISFKEKTKENYEFKIYKDFK
ncbi:MAG: hypothetical protein N4A54_09670 [Peptostreptococcaceae bacterium]|jgi:hypothetical protein|nr:hypothetical protein [Peptostreptococcaceae bacterium]